MLSANQIRKGLQNPRKGIQYLRRRAYAEAHYRLRDLNQRYHRRRSAPDGYDLLSADWDTAIILDACRFDTFAECNRFNGELRRETAPGSESREYFQRTFRDQVCHDMVYVTGNPYITTLDEDTFYDVYLDEAWNTTGTEAPPDRMTDAAIQAHKDHPDKRVVVHYMQPHLPILAPDWKDINEEMFYHKSEWFPGKDTSIEEVQEAYKANLKYVLDYVEELLDAIRGKILITADHGELVGDRQQPIPIRGFNHNENLYVDSLLQVPWLELDNGPRREIRSDEPAGRIELEEREKEERLRALGYL